VVGRPYVKWREGKDDRWNDRAGMVGRL